MNITLYYVYGINETDTPVFDTLANQALFFSECERYVIDTGFYPPYFNNRIKLSSSDFNLTQSDYNYLSLNFDDKNFYYFITEKKYIAEDIVELTIEMDTIQTYMFDISFVYSHINRLTIPRWKSNGKINREYIRENLSNGNMTKIETPIIINSDTSKWFACCRILKDTTLVNYNTNVYTNSIAPTYKDLAFVEFVPLTNSNFIQGGTTGTSNIEYFYRSILDESLARDAYIIPFNPFSSSDITYSTSGGMDTYTLPSSQDNYWLLPGTTTQTQNYYCVRVQGTCNYAVSSTIYPFAFVRNAYLTTPFSIFHIPALLDNSYIELTFGDYRKRTEFPLYNLIDSYVYLQYWADITSGTIYYGMNDTNTSLDYKYHSIVSTNSSLGLELRNDAWKNWLANNKASAGIALALAPLSLVDTPFNIGKSLDIPLKHDTYSAISAIGKPDSIISTGSYTKDVLQGCGYIYAQEKNCDDIEEVAKMYESIGYKVSVNTTSNLFETNNRYYYDYIQCDEINLEMSDKETKDRIRQRFINGLRLWHTTNGIPKCYSVSLSIGQLCIYDNVEV